VADYRLYFLSRAGRVEKAEAYEAPDDAQAITHAMTLLDGRDTELWSRDRLVRKISGEQS
jgi:hypothetical protein